MIRTIKLLIDLLFPSRCLFCRVALSVPGACPVCETALPRIPEGKLFALGDSVCVAPLFYEGLVRELIHRFKFQGKYALARPMSGYISQTAEHLLPADIVTWVPVSRRRLRTRGYDQAMLLARETAARLGLPLAETLRKALDAPTQNELTDASSRRQNVAGAFQARGGTVVGRRVLLVDDVLTSGATLGECVRLLREAGAASVVCAVFAKTRHAPPEKARHELKSSKISHAKFS